ncbi:MAG: choloylglycine hydrolase [Oscillospiraceae bacterium]|nr:choloylglycine hydrolase [Oscillospiraceae bacterium]
MCTAVTLKTKDFYFGRTLDHELSYAEEVTVTPRNFPLSFRNAPPLTHHYAMIGMAHVVDDYPLYFDAVNEKGLAMAGLNFIGYAHYAPLSAQGQVNIAHFELLLWILAQCASVEEAEQSLAGLSVSSASFNSEIPPADLHWIIADHHCAITVEARRDGLHVLPNPVGVLTNNPPFEDQLLHLNDFMTLSAKSPRNLFAPSIDLHPYSLGMGALGLPGDLSSRSRFVRAAFTKLNSVCGTSEHESVGQFFHILDSVAQTQGCNTDEDGHYETTLYTSCCNTDKGIYYYTTYGNRQITAVNMHREKLDDSFLVRYSLIQSQQIRDQN